MAKFLVFFKIFFVIISGLKAGNATSLEKIIPAFDTYIKSAMEEWKVPGAAVAIVKEGKIIFLKTYGTKEKGVLNPVTVTTIFPIVSLSKSFTATLVAKMVEKGLLNWDDKVISFFPDFKLSDSAVTADFTIRDLLAHRSGLTGYAGDSLTELGWSDTDILGSLHKIPLGGTFRKTYDYQNVFVGIVGYIIEKIMKKPLSEVYNDLLFKPLGLMNTYIGDKGLTGGESILTRLKTSLFLKQIKLPNFMIILISSQEFCLMVIQPFILL